MIMTRSIAFIISVLIASTLFAQEHGPIVGGSIGKLHEKTQSATYFFDGYQPHYHVGYGYRQHFNGKFALDAIALFGTQGTDYSFYEKGSTSVKMYGKYVSVGAVATYECFRNFRVGLGADLACYVDRIGDSPTEESKTPEWLRNSRKNAIDVPLVAKVGYSFKWFELQLTYKQGTCDLMRNDKIGKVTSRDFQLSLFVPLFGLKKN